MKTDRDEEIQAALAGAGKIDDIDGGEDMNAYRRLYAGLSNGLASLGPDFSSRVMLRIIHERLKRARIEAVMISSLLSILAISGIFILFLVLSYLDWFHFNADLIDLFAAAFVAVTPAFINYLWPCLISIIILFGMDQALSHWQNA